VGFSKKKFVGGNGLFQFGKRKIVIKFVKREKSRQGGKGSKINTIGEAWYASCLRQLKSKEAGMLSWNYTEDKEKGCYGKWAANYKRKLLGGIVGGGKKGLTASHNVLFPVRWRVQKKGSLERVFLAHVQRSHMWQQNSRRKTRQMGCGQKCGGYRGNGGRGQWGGKRDKKRLPPKEKKNWYSSNTLNNSGGFQTGRKSGPKNF